MRDYDPTLGRYLQADPLGLVDRASVYGYALQNPGRYTDPREEFVPILIGIAIGLILDEVVETIEAYCGCADSIDKYAVVGGARGAFGPYATKPRTGISGGGRS